MGRAKLPYLALICFFAGVLAWPAQPETPPLLPHALSDPLDAPIIMPRGHVSPIDGVVFSADGRAIEILERINSPAAIQVLETLATGSAKLRPTRDVEVVLRRMKHTAALENRR